MKTQVKHHQIFIGGKWVDSTGEDAQDVINPANGEVIATVPKGTEKDVDGAVAAARRAFDEVWFDSTPRERSEMLLKIAGVVEEHGEELARIESENVGKPLATTLSEEIPPIADCFRFFAGAARVLEGRSTGEYMKGLTSMVRREPLGVVGSIAPWNYPLMMAAWKLGPALAAGNTIGGFFNAGQDCTAATRIIAGPDIFDGLLKGLVPAVSGLKVGDPAADDTEMGPVVSAEQLERVSGFVDRARKEGAEVLTGGAALKRNGS